MAHFEYLSNKHEWGFSHDVSNKCILMYLIYRSNEKEGLNNEQVGLNKQNIRI
jgi:hypothetical protein